MGNHIKIQQPVWSGRYFSVNKALIDINATDNTVEFTQVKAYSGGVYKLLKENLKGEGNIRGIPMWQFDLDKTLTCVIKLPNSNTNTRTNNNKTNRQKELFSLTDVVSFLNAETKIFTGENLRQIKNAILELYKVKQLKQTTIAEKQTTTLF